MKQTSQGILAIIFDLSSDWFKLKGVGKLIPRSTTLCFTKVFQFGGLLCQKALASFCRCADFVMIKIQPSWWNFTETFCLISSWTRHDAYLTSRNSQVTLELLHDVQMMPETVLDDVMTSKWPLGDVQMLDLSGTQNIQTRDIRISTSIMMAFSTKVSRDILNQHHYDGLLTSSWQNSPETFQTNIVTSGSRRLPEESNPRHLKTFLTNFIMTASSVSTKISQINFVMTGSWRKWTDPSNPCDMKRNHETSFVTPNRANF